MQNSLCEASNIIQSDKGFHNIDALVLDHELFSSCFVWVYTNIMLIIRLLEYYSMTDLHYIGDGHYVYEE